MIYPFLRIFAIPIAFVLWILYQLFLKKKPLVDLKNDMLVGGAFIVILLFIFYLLS
jgi:hypothetical protein